METKFPFPFRRLKKSDSDLQDKLGPLFGMVGNWSSGKNPNTGLNIIAVPGPQPPPNDPEHFGGGFVLEVIPYTETLNFEPISVTLNRGPFVNGIEQTQEIGALLYDQVITSNCNSDFCKQRGFPAGTAIHAEKGMILNIASFSDGYQICRMGTIPHGNSIMLLGTSDPGAMPVIAPVDSTPHPADPSVQLPLDYQEPYTLSDENPWPVVNPNEALVTANVGLDFRSSIHLNVASNRASGGILNIPFIQANINATQMSADYWINTLKDGTIQLQYSQTIDLVFPATGHPETLIVWPHIDVNTLTRDD